MLSLFLYGVESSRDKRSSLQNGLWGLKMLAWGAFLVVAFVLPNGFFTAWSTFIDFPGAFVFILIQLLILIDFAYTLSESLIEKWEENEDRQYLVILLLLTGGAFLVSLIGTILMYVWFGNSSCKLNQFFITFNLILCFFISIISISPAVQEANPKSGLAQASIVALYSTYLIFSGIISAPSDQCNKLTNGTSETMSVVVGSLLTFLALAYSTSRAATKSHVLATGTTESISLDEASNSVDDEDGSWLNSVDDEQDSVKYSYSFFHFVFAMATMYLAMMITSWNTLTLENHRSGAVGKSVTSMWMKVISSWIVVLLYAWTLIAPVILPDREFT